MGVHLLAIQVSDENTPEVRRQEKTLIYDSLSDLVGTTDMNDPDLQIECWWDADDDRADRSDNDSAVFVTMGTTAEVYRHLANEGLTGRWNVPDPVQATVEQRSAMLAKLRALRAEYTAVTGGRDIEDDDRYVSQIEDFVSEDESLPEDVNIAPIVARLHDDYLMSGLSVDFITEDRIGEDVWTDYRDRARDHCEERAIALGLRGASGV